MKTSRTTAACAIVLLTLAGAACSKKVASAPPPPPAAQTPAAATTPRPTPAPERATTASNPPASTPASRYPNAETRARIDQLLARISDAYFDYNKSSLRPDALKTLQSDSVELRNILAQYPDYKLQVEGYCDERGSAEYNLALGDQRAQAAKTYLVNVGIPDGQLSVVSYGKERQVCDEHDEACWQKNRRIHVVALAQK